MREIIKYLKSRKSHLRLECAKFSVTDLRRPKLEGRIRELSYLIEKFQNNEIQNLVDYSESKVLHLKKMRTAVIKKEI